MKYLNKVLFLITLTFTLALSAVNANAGATLRVNSPNFGSNCDQQLSLEEAANLAEGLFPFPRPLTTGEKNQIINANLVLTPGPPPCDIGGLGWTVAGGIGLNSADDIIIVDNGVSVLTGSLGLGKNDDLDGLKPNGTKIVLDGTGVAQIAGIFMAPDSGSQIRNVEIRDFSQIGILGEAQNGAIFEGLDIHDNGTTGILMRGNDVGGLHNIRNVRIGGTQPQHTNRIFANGSIGISIEAYANADRSGEQNIQILNNLIGTSDGVTDNGNGSHGIFLVHTFGVTIGDTTNATRNIISGNNGDGIRVIGQAAVNNVIIGNFIGTTTNSATPLGNTGSGVAMLSGAGDFADTSGSPPNRIGRTGQGNVLSANLWGVLIADTNTSNNVVQGNYIGTNIGGNTDVGNVLDGVLVGGGTYDNLVGGTLSGESNLIAFNNRSGIFTDGVARNQFRQNRIFSNDGLGIDITPFGVNPNDVGDGDTGSNDLQNYPVITFVRANNTSVTIGGSLNSKPNQTYTLEFFGNTSVDTTGYGEGRNLLGSLQVTTNGSGNATFNQVFTIGIASTAQWVTATATDSTGNTSEYSQARNICADMVLSPGSILAPLGGIASNFTYINSVGCAAPTAAGDQPWITTGSILAGTVNFTVAANVGPPRDGNVVVTYQNGSGTNSTVNFLVSQNNGCTFSLVASSANVPASASFNNPVGVSASANNCQWVYSSNAPWIIVAGSNGTGSANLPYNVAANTGPPRQGTISVAGQTFTVNQASPQTSRSLFDFDGDNKTDLSVFRPNGANAEWWYLKSSNGGNGAAQFGLSTDRMSPADFTGDSKTDIAVFRPSNGQWLVLRSEDFSFYAFPFGTNGDIPVPADYDADGKADAAVFRPSTVTWYISRSTGGTTITTFGSAGDQPVPADYDGDGKADIGIFRPGLGQWWIQRSTAGLLAVQFGQTGDRTTPGDFTGDGKADIAYFRPTTGFWTVLRSENLSFYAFPFGTNGDLATPGDYDGDGKMDAAVFRPSASTWYANKSAGGTLIQQFGQAGDLPVPNAFVR